MPPSLLPPFLQYLSQSEPNDSESTQVLPMMEAQKDRLDSLVAASSSSPKRQKWAFIRGQQVHYEAGCGPYKSHARDNLYFIFWRYLDESSLEDQERVSRMSQSCGSALPSIDCMIAYFDGDSVTFDLACTELLRPGAAEV